MTESSSDPGGSSGSGSSGFLGDREKDLGKVSEVLDGAEKTQYQLPEVVAGYKRGDDLNQPSGTPPSVAAPGGGAANVGLASPIEFVHFGWVYRDKSTFFPHLDERDDISKLTAQDGAHAIMLRAALQRECVLLAGFISAYMKALKDEETQKGGLGTVLQVAADLLGGAAGTNQTLTDADLNPLIDKAKTVGQTLNSATIDYAVLHKAGCDLHELRVKYRTLVKEQADKAATKYESEDAGLLSGLPGIGDMIPGPLGSFLSVIQKLSSKVFDVYLGMLMQLSLNMEPKIEDACRAISLESIRKRHVPVFPVWFEPPPAPTDDNLIDPLGSGSGPLGSVTDAINSGIGAFNDKVGKPVEEVLDFLSRPSKATPGGPFVDLAFQLPPAPTDAAADANAVLLPPEQRLKPLDTLALATQASFDTALGVPVPSPLSDLMREVSKVTLDFLHAIYGKLVTVDPAQPLGHGEMIAAARLHLVDQVCERLLQAVGFLDQFRAMNINILGKQLSGEALVNRGKEFLAEKITPVLDPIINYAASRLSILLEGARRDALTTGGPAAMTMEVYLALLPSAAALLFRNVFFPIWDLLKNTVFAAITDALTPGLDKVDEIAGKAKGYVDDVRTGLTKAQNLYDAATTHGLDAGLDGVNTQPYEDALNSGLAPEAAGLGPATAVRFPLASREAKGKAAGISAEVLQQVEPDNKWDTAEAADGAPADAAPAAPQPAPAAQ